MWKEYNPNPSRLKVGDCTVRAISMVFGITWEDAFIRLSNLALLMNDMPSANRVWGEYLRRNGFRRFIIPDTCPDCYTIADFAEDHPKGRYVVATGSHVVCVINGVYYDSWDSGGEIPVYYWKRA